MNLNIFFSFQGNTTPPVVDQPVSTETAEGPTTKEIRCTAETVRAYSNCYMCGKPRCFYANQKLSREQRVELEQILEDTMYSCGARSSSDSIAVESGITCESPVSHHYFVNRCQPSFPLVCYVCGEGDVEPSAEGDPVCEFCASSFRTRSRAKKLRRK